MLQLAWLFSVISGLNTRQYGNMRCWVLYYFFRVSSSCSAAAWFASVCFLLLIVVSSNFFLIHQGMRVVHSLMAKFIKEHSGGKPVFSSALFYCINEGYTAAISCATAFLWSCLFHDSWAQAFYSASSLGRAETAVSAMCFTSSFYTGERGQSSLPHWPQQPEPTSQPTVPTMRCRGTFLPALWGESSAQELCCASGRGRECRWLQMTILKCLKWFVEMEAALSCLQCKEQWLCSPGSAPWIWIQSCSGANLICL